MKLQCTLYGRMSLQSTSHHQLLLNMIECLRFAPKSTMPLYLRNYLLCHGSKLNSGLPPPSILCNLHAHLAMWLYFLVLFQWVRNFPYNDTLQCSPFGDLLSFFLNSGALIFQSSWVIRANFPHSIMYSLLDCSNVYFSLTYFPFLCSVLRVGLCALSVISYEPCFHLTSNCLVISSYMYGLWLYYDSLIFCEILGTRCYIWLSVYVRFTKPWSLVRFADKCWSFGYFKVVINNILIRGRQLVLMQQNQPNNPSHS